MHTHLYRPVIFIIFVTSSFVFCNEEPLQSILKKDSEISTSKIKVVTFANSLATKKDGRENLFEITSDDEQNLFTSAEELSSTYQDIAYNEIEFVKNNKTCTAIRKNYTHFIIKATKYDELKRENSDLKFQNALLCAGLAVTTSCFAFNFFVTNFQDDCEK